MAGTVTCNLTTVSDANALSPATPVAGTWGSSAGSPALDTEIYREATGSIAEGLRVASNANYIAFTRTSGTWDFSATHIYIWVMTTAAAFLDTFANGGVEIRVGASTNFGYWKVAGKDTWGGEWRCFVVDTSRAFDRNSGTAPNKAAINSVGINFKMLSAPRNVDNTWVDVIRYGNTGLTITGGTAGTPTTWEDLYTESNSNAAGKAYGLVDKVGNADYVLKGPITIGDASGTASTYFKDTSKVVTFDGSLPVSSTLYELKLAGNGTGSTEVYFGNKSGTAGISGCFFNVAGAVKFKVTATDTNVTKYGFYGCSFVGAGDIAFPAYNANKEVLNCNFEACNQVTVNTAIIKYCNFLNSSAEAVKISSTTHNFSDNNMIACSRAIHFDAAGTYPLSNVVFTNCTYDIKNSSNGTVTVTYTGSSNPSDAKLENTGGGSIVLSASISLTINVVDADGSAVTSACEITVVKNSDTTVLFQEENVTDGSSVYTYSSGAGTVVYINVMNVSGYQAKTLNNYTLPSSSTSVTIPLDEERYFSNP